MRAPGRMAAPIALVLVLGGFCAFSQESAESPAPPAESTAEPAAGGAPETPPQGDVVTLKSGKKLLGFQVVRQNTREIVVRVMDGVEITLPMRQVASVELDNIDPNLPSQQEGTGKPEHELIPGIKLAPALYERLVRPVSQEALNYSNADAVANVVALSQQVEVPLEVAPAVEQIPADQRKWTVQIEPQATFFAILNHYFLGQFPALAVIYRYDRVILTTRAEAEKDASAGGAAPESPPATTAPPASPPAEVSASTPPDTTEATP